MTTGAASEAGELSEAEVQQLKATFDLFDDKRHGYIETARVPTLIRAVGEAPTQAKVNEITKTVQEAGGRFTLDDLLAAVASLRSDSESKRPTTNEVEAAFRVFDPKGKGYITKTELSKVLTTVGDALSQQEVDDLLVDADVDSQGRIDYVRFSSKLTN